MGRMTLRDFTFSDGTLVPAGSSLFVNSHGLYGDEEIHASPPTFDGFRYLREDNSSQAMLTTPTLDFQAFGYGRHVCPGRFLGSYQLKTVIAHVLMTYDLRSDEASDSSVTEPKGAENMPNIKAAIWLKKRVVEQEGKKEKIISKAFCSTSVLDTKTEWCKYHEETFPACVIAGMPTGAYGFGDGSLRR
ncbi:unnamed protein product [Cyclocybe aegerita]|uniref:Cytochrome P450 n=1 Tax=Cyclocybe aegerita TaxID=1973307 RepID=A0A8S0WCZ1_CYCAE|nr:unnamed protein product [Cyclocybe aegerita]